VIERARTILSELERSDREKPKRNVVEDLPLFAAPMRIEPPTPAAPTRDRLREVLDALDPDELTPREALEALYRLKAERNA
jgi:DNA mismatch repair protein MutS